MLVRSLLCNGDSEGSHGYYFMGYALTDRRSMEHKWLL